MSSLTARRVLPLFLLGAGLLLLLTWTNIRGADAVPPGGPVTDPGDPPASVEILTPVAAQRGVVRFSGTGWLTNQGQPQRVYVKFDDYGISGIGPYLADQDGNLSGSVSLDHAEAPPYINDLNRDHWLRFLAGPSGKFPKNGPARSLTGDFKLVPFGTDPDNPDPQPPVGRGQLTLQRIALRPSTGMLELRVRVNRPFVRLRISSRTAGKVRVRPGAKPRRVFLGKARRSARSGRAWTLQVPLKRSGWKLVETRAKQGRPLALTVSIRSVDVLPLKRVARVRPRR